MFTLKSTTKETNAKTKSDCLEAWAQLLERKDIGFFDLPNRNDNWVKSGQRGEEIRKSYNTLAIVGIGGSGMGARALDDFFSSRQSKKHLLFFDNLDACSFESEMERLVGEADIHWLFISKSGTTLETLATLNFVNQNYEKRGWNLSRHSTVVSESKSSPLTDWARAKDVPVLEIPEDVGGRFSVLTPVGLVPSAFLGLSVNEMRSGTQWALKQSDLIATMAAQSLMSFERSEWTTLFWAYSNHLNGFTQWFQQLFAESLGKKTNNEGKPAPRVSSPFGCLGPRDQHSILQQVMEGERDKFIWFFRVGPSENQGEKLTKSLFPQQEFLINKGLGDVLSAEVRATTDSLGQAEVQSLTIFVDKLGAANIGALFMAMELVIGVLGEALNINAYDQPGVEAGKVLAKQYISN